MAELLAIQQKMTGWVAQLESITPGSGCYLNEVTPPPPLHLQLPNKLSIYTLSSLEKNADC